MKKQLLFSVLCLTLSANSAQTCNTNIQASTPDSRFTTTAETVTDNTTGLMWMRCSLGQTGNDCSGGSAAAYNWQQALEAANTYNFAGYNDWRLPNMKELDSIVELKCVYPAINLTVFPNTLSVFNAFYWSSSPYAYYSSQAPGINFHEGLSGSYSKASSRYVRLVRDL